MKLFKYKTVYRNILNLRSNGTFTLNVNNYMPPGQVGRYGVLCDKKYADPVTSIKCESNWYRYRGASSSIKADTVFMSPKSHLSRDIVRNSGYKIVRDKDKADIIVIPTPKEMKYDYAPICVWEPSDEKVSMIYICTPYYGYTITDQDKEMIKDELPKRFADDAEIYFYENEFESMRLYFMPKVDEWCDIITKAQSTIKYKYVLDSQLDIKGTSDINLENLELWQHMFNDSNLLAKTVAQSKWREYPLTVFTFFKTVWNKYTSEAEPALRFVLDSLGYEKYGGYEPFTMLTISPDDWNLCQKFLAKQITGSEDGGFVDTNKVNNFASEARVHLKYKTCIKPHLINEAENYKSLMITLDNSRK